MGPTVSCIISFLIFSSCAVTSYARITRMQLNLVKLAVRVQTAGDFALVFQMKPSRTIIQMSHTHHLWIWGVRAHTHAHPINLYLFILVFSIVHQAFTELEKKKFKLIHIVIVIVYISLHTMRLKKDGYRSCWLPDPIRFNPIRKWMIDCNLFCNVQG